MFPVVYALEGATPAYETIIGTITDTVSSTNITAVLSYALPLAIAMVFLWWAVRKVAKILMSAFRRGKLKF